MTGLLLVDKPAGLTSFDVIRRLRPVLGVRKIGHAGTLDPAATGLLLLLLGPATKQAQRLLKLDKSYVATITLGHDSTTADAEGELTAVSQRVPAKAEIAAALQQFRGPIQQTPPAFSALKVKGRRAYQLARRGQAPELAPRAVTIQRLELLAYAYPQLQLEATVSSGTYIRSLAADIGRALGTGGYLSQLRRTAIADYDVADALPLAAITPELAAQKLITL